MERRAAVAHRHSHHSHHHQTADAEVQLVHSTASLVVAGSQERSRQNNCGEEVKKMKKSYSRDTRQVRTRAVAVDRKEARPTGARHSLMTAMMLREREKMLPSPLAENDNI